MKRISNLSRVSRVVAYWMNQNPSNVLPLVPNEGHQAQVIIHPKPHSVSIRVIQVFEPGMLQNSFIGLEKAPEHRPATALPILTVVIELEYLFSGNRTWPIRSDDTIAPESLTGGKQDACSVLLFHVLRNCHTDPDVPHEGLCMCKEDGVDFASMTSVCYIVFRIVSCPGHVGDELAVVLAEFHGSDSATTAVVDLLADLAVVPSVDDSASIREKVKDICFRVSKLSRYS